MNSSGSVDAVNNYWGSATGPYHATENPDGLGTNISDRVPFKPFITTPNVSGVASSDICCSSVLFLPGIMSSRLYDSGGNKLWETNIVNRASNVEKLKLDNNGNSKSAITTGKVIDEFSYTGIVGLNLYKSFFEDLAQAMDNDLISSYMPYAYDWRMSAEDNVASGDLESKLRQLAASSKTGKVTLVAHSNGGIVAKELINELGSEASSLVDKVVFVGVPQLGTPQAMATLLHGYRAGIPTYLTSEQARDFSKNAPMTYQLLPHHDYYSGDGVHLYAAPLIQFEAGAGTNNYISRYGKNIEDIATLNKFLNGEDGRSDPAYADLKYPAKANIGVSAEVSGQMTGISGDWNIPAGIEVHQIAGVGEDTLSGLAYKTLSFCSKVIFQNNQLYCPQKEKTLSYNPVFTVSGDGTVVEHSALAMSELEEGVTRWWVDLERYNSFFEFNVDRDHKDLFEIQDISDLIIKNIVATSTDLGTYNYIETSRIALTGQNRLTIFLHSPLSLSYTESDGTVVNEQNPYGKHSRYTRFGEVQLIDVFDNEQGTVNMQGLSKGSFTLELEESRNGKVVASSTFSAIPSIANTKVSMIVDGGSIGDVDDLVVDYNSDKEPDIALEVSTGTVVSLPTKPTPSPLTKDLIQKLKKVIDNKVADKAVKQDLKQRTDKILDLYNKWEKSTATSKTDFATKIKTEATELQKQLDKYQKNKKIKRGAATKMERLLKAIKKSV
ncbi:alpha/beta hydrolase [Candidatus Woesebacteria bacterium]|nr:alpha/beta hydrolase [Candidatus Woesebacteria bacterium]